MEQSGTRQNTSDHLANERTLLAWVRTAIGIMAFGFVVVKFSLFIRQIALVVGKSLTIPQYGYSAPIGIALVAVGALSLLFSLIRYHRIAKQIDSGTFRRSSSLLSIIVIIVLITAVLLIFYLIKTT